MAYEVFLECGENAVTLSWTSTSTALKTCFLEVNMYGYNRMQVMLS